MANIIQIELCQEDRARLDAILSALNKMLLEPIALKTAEPTIEELMQAHPVPAEESTELPWNDAPSKSAFIPNIEDIRSLIMTLSNGGKRNVAADIVHKYAKKVSDIKEADYPTVYAELKKATQEAIKR